jgi:hypothetical protein
MTIQERIDLLGDVVFLVGVYINQNIESVTDTDAWNIAGFEADKIESSWGWHFQTLAKPSLEALELIKQELP